jgi:hypothetical protein
MMQALVEAAYIMRNTPLELLDLLIINNCHTTGFESPKDPEVLSPSTPVHGSSSSNIDAWMCVSW